MGSVTAYDAPGENAEPLKLLPAVGHPPAVADACRSPFRRLIRGALSRRDRKFATLGVAAALESVHAHWDVIDRPETVVVPDATQDYNEVRTRVFRSFVAPTEER